MTQPIWYDSTEAGAPTLNNAAGSLLEVLRACLVNGFNARAVTSIAVVSGVATATAAAHGFRAGFGKLVLISGAPVAALNGRKQPSNVLTNSFTFPAPGVADGTYTGTISARRAPLGWAEPYNAGNVSIFARTVQESTAMMLRVNDSHVAPSTINDARVLMVESATSTLDFVNQSPTAAQISGGLRWFKGQDSATAKMWAVFGDDRLFFIVLPNVNGGGSLFTYAIHAFGDPLAVKTPDPFLCLLAGATQSVTAGSISNRLGTRNGINAGTTDPHTVLARSFSGFNFSRPCETCSIGAGGVPFGSVTQGDPDLSDFLLTGPALLIEQGTTVRATLPGLVDPTARAPFQALPQFALIQSVSGTDRRFVSVLFRSTGGSEGNALIDVSGPWR